MRVRHSRQSRRDMVEIWEYTSEKFGDDVADELAKKLTNRMSLLARFPILGPARPELGEGVRQLVVGTHIVLYRLAGKEVHVARVAHGARDLTKLLKKRRR